MIFGFLERLTSTQVNHSLTGGFLQLTITDVRM